MNRRAKWLKPDSLILLNETKSSNLDISWSSSDDENAAINKKCYNKDRIDGKRNDLYQEHSLPKDDVILLKPIDRSSMNSPIIGQELEEELSPTFNDNSVSGTNKSPIIGKSHKAKDWKKRKKRKLTIPEYLNDTSKSGEARNNDSEQFNISVDSSDNSQNQFINNLSQVVSNTNFIRVKLSDQIKPHRSSGQSKEAHSLISNDIFSECSEEIYIDFLTPSSSEKESDIIISQYSSTQGSHTSFECKSSNSSDVSTKCSADNTETSSINIPTAVYRKTRKKRFKKEGFYKQLQKALQKNEASISMWQHEIHINKVDYDCDDVLHVLVYKIAIEFKHSICECSIIDKNKSERQGTKCIVILNSRYDELVNCPQYIKVYKPYSVSTVNYLNENLTCYYNICKILFDP